MNIKITIFSIVFTFLLLSGKTQAQTDGTLDTTFTIGTGFDGPVEAITLQADGKILVGGNFTLYDGQPQGKIVRLNTDGSIDTSFNSGIGFNMGRTVYSIVVQPDNKILVGGGFFTYKGLPQNGLIRLNTDGSTDLSFDVGTGFKMNGTQPGDVHTIALQPDGKILVGGAFTTFDSQILNGKNIVRLNTDGSLDSSFTFSPGGSGGTVHTIALQSDGKILAGGNINIQNIPQAGSDLVRLNSDGSVDTTLNIGTGFSGEVSALALQPDGKILVGGKFASYDGNGASGGQNRIARLNIDGSLDTLFTIGTGFNGWVTAITRQFDNKVLIGGTFLTYKGQSKSKMIRLHSDASIDSSFDIGTGVNENSGGTSMSVRSIALQTDGKILIGGEFTSYNGQSQNRIARLHNVNTVDIEELDKKNVRVYPNPVKDFLYFDKEVQKAIVADLGGKVLTIQRNINEIDMSALQNGVYLITIELEDGMKETKKIIKK